MNGPVNMPEPAPLKAEGPQPLIRDLPEGEPYPVEVLGDLAPAVRAVQGVTQAPVAIPAASALAVASLAIQGHADVEALAGARPTSLFLLTIAASGERKSSCDAPLMRGVGAYEETERKKQADDIRKFEDDHALWKSEHDAIIRAAGSTKDEKRIGARADLEGLREEPRPPVPPDRTVSEPTFEGLCEMLRWALPSLGLFSDEGGQFLGGHAMNSDNRQKTLAAFNGLWSGEPIRRTRKGDGFYTLHGRRVAVHLMAQPGVAHALLADSLAGDTGFLARFLIAEPVSTIGTRAHAKAITDWSSIEAFTRRLGEILRTEMKMDQHTKALELRMLRLSLEARDLLIRFSDAVEAAQAPGGEYEGIRATASKAAEQAARIAGVLTLWRDLEASEITEAVMADAVKLAGWYLGEALRLASVAKISVEVTQAEKLRKWLLGSWPHDHVTLREIVQFGPGALRESPKAKAAIALLAQHGWLAAIGEPTIIRGTARREAWRIVRVAGSPACGG